MQYTREFIPLKECTSGYGRGGMIPHGIARMEYYDGAVKLRINIYGLTPGAGPYTVYAVGISGDTYRRVTLGQLQPDALGRCELGYRAPVGDWDPYRIRIVSIALQDGVEVLTGYVDGVIDWKALQDADAAPETALELAPEITSAAAPEAAVELAPEITSAAASDAATETALELAPEESDTAPDPGSQTMSETESEQESAAPMRHAVVLEEDAAPITSKAAARDALQYMFQAYPRIYPFRNSEAKWIRIHPRDIAPLPTDVITLENSPFLQRGYLSFKHLVLGYAENGGDACDTYYLGVPFRYHQEQEEIARNWGFAEFRNSFGTVPMKGDYGYWIMQMRFDMEKSAS